VKIEQTLWGDVAARGAERCDPALREAQLVLVFGSASRLRDDAFLLGLRQAYPGAQLCGCSAAGEMWAGGVEQEALLVTAMRFEHTRIDAAHIDLAGGEASQDAGAALAYSIGHTGLRHVLLLCDGARVDARGLLIGLLKRLPIGARLTGGLSVPDDGTHDGVVLWDEHPARAAAMIVGFYGDRLRVDSGTLEHDHFMPRGPREAELALFVSGARLRCGHMDREVGMHATVRGALSPATVLAGFYSGGNVSTHPRRSPFEVSDRSMTLTVFAER
jgi:hypothetical protein